MASSSRHDILKIYTDFEYAMKAKYTEDEVVEMDTVKGIQGYAHGRPNGR